MSRCDKPLYRASLICYVGLSHRRWDKPVNRASHSRWDNPVDRASHNISLDRLHQWSLNIKSTRASVFIFAYWTELETCRHVAIDHDRASFPRIEIRLRKQTLKPCRRNLQTTCCCNPAGQPSQCTPARKSCLWHP